ncbi:hypothetical protein CWI38_0129p0040 [Hamiltosporidium tvaerminnensis]|uniref:Uncharacterized protein n=1 Tax=Hamiltosporidium tvaerminnensis TaxID=1176355 RepID=A0A4Q9M298_9MICR|nr:hypothetical protein CWI38_0129p0040 [Hamiltosporidium tvaerminnensis]
MFEEALLSLAFAIDIPKSTLFDIFKSEKYIKRISSTVIPTLTDKNKIDRLKFCLSKVNLANNRDLLFDDLYDYVHIDKKWFYLTKVKRSYYLMLNEEKPRFSTKIMFMAAVARPRYDAHRKLYFDGKIGIWPFVYQEPAQRNSKKRAKGTMITKNVKSVTAKTIYVQQDNAKPNFFDNDADIVALGSADDWNIQFKLQTANSPDLNVLDLASPHTIDEFINCLQYAFHQLESNTLDNVFTALQACMEPIMLADGGNGYKIPHLSKRKLRPEGRLLEKYVLSKKHTIMPNQISSEHINVNIYFLKFYSIFTLIFIKMFEIKVILNLSCTFFDLFYFFANVYHISGQREYFIKYYPNAKSINKLGYILILFK